MKKTIIIAAAAATLLGVVSCNKENIPNPAESLQNGTPVRFGMYLPGATKAGAFGQSSTDFLKGNPTADPAVDNGGFGIFGYYTDNGTYVADASTGSPINFMYNQQVRWNGTSWAYTPIKYWPNETGDAATSRLTDASTYSIDKLSFLAYAPYVATNASGIPTGAIHNDTTEGILSVSANTDKGDAKITFQVPARGDQQVDLLWGVAANNAANYTDVDGNTVTINPGRPFLDLSKPKFADEEIKFVFKHALAKVDFKVQAIVDEATSGDPAIALNDNTKIYLRKIELLGPYAKKAVLNLNNAGTDGFNDLRSVPKWEFSDSPYEYFNNLTKLNAGDNNNEDVKGYIVAYTFNDNLKDGQENTAAEANAESDDLNSDETDGVTQGTTGVTATLKNALKDNRQFLIIPTDMTSETEIIPIASEEGITAPGATKIKDLSYVRVTYDVETADAALSQTLTDGTTHGSKIHNVIVRPLNINFEGNKAYTIKLQLGMTSVKVSAEVNGWEDTAAAQPINLPSNNEAGQ